MSIEFAVDGDAELQEIILMHTFLTTCGDVNQYAVHLNQPDVAENDTWNNSNNIIWNRGNRRTRNSHRTVNILDDIVKVLCMVKDCSDMNYELHDSNEHGAAYNYNFHKIDINQFSDIDTDDFIPL